jgi:hypothetical protein
MTKLDYGIPVDESRRCVAKVRVRRCRRPPLSGIDTCFLHTHLDDDPRVKDWYRRRTHKERLRALGLLNYFPRGTKVRYHPIIGGEHDGGVYTVRALQWRGAKRGRGVAWLEGEADCVAVKALSRAE